MVEDWIAKGDNEPPPKVLPDFALTVRKGRWYYATTLSLVKNEDAAAARVSHARFCIEVRFLVPPTAAHLEELSTWGDYRCKFDLVNFDDSPTNLSQFDDNTFAASPRSIATSWIKECASSHPLCLQAGAVGTRWLPTRLIDVVQQGEIDSCFVSRYSTWEFTQNIPGSYHHDMEDWLSESMKMKSVYANGFINIAASASKDSSQGLFRQRDPSRSTAQHPLDIDFQGIRDVDVKETRKDKERPVSTKGGKRLHRCILVSRDEWLSNVEQSTLAMRGWVLQEQLLSPRILIFGTRQIYWQCFQRLSSEEGTPMIRGRWDMDIKKAFGRELKGHDSGGQQEETRRLVALWAKIVQVYCRTQLTKPTDCLVALSGLAKAFLQKLPQDEYLAGMWQSNLLQDLVWQCSVSKVDYSAAVDSSSTSPSLGQIEYCAPTFCWASVPLPSAIKFIDTEEGLPRAFYFTVLDLELKHKTSDTTGLVSSGHLDIQAKLLRVRLYSNATPAVSKLGPGPVPVKIDFGPDDTDPTDRSDECLLVSFDRAFELPSEACRVFHLFVAKVDEYMRNPIAKFVVWRAACMLLEVGDVESGIYRRIGMATVSKFVNESRSGDLQDPADWISDTRGLPGAPIPNRGRSGEQYILRII
ncbi:hypothetical protein MCOR03_007488 [Pyricularia oryzae]|nr:hypothetical protein MCOR01_010090 [Pyricularia oryzae]KAI6395614.1 hypothetical protein MCOR24_009288 [Pyricularia oryzae]KAI6456711.1 hypothetical protein MCOR15_007088 [Pyricularia oryzae]KAI6554163.1 hypothetical protein MCOR03_007488 [Pyricularia oryzae]